MWWLWACLSVCVCVFLHKYFKTIFHSWNILLINLCKIIILLLTECAWVCVRYYAYKRAVWVHLISIPAGLLAATLCDLQHFGYILTSIFFNIIVTRTLSKCLVLLLVNCSASMPNCMRSSAKLKYIKIKNTLRSIFIAACSIYRR